MRTLIFTVAILFMVPALRAQQDEPKQNPTQSVSQETTENSNVQNSLPESIRPGHPLDPADVDILTGKRDREIEAARRAAAPVMMGGYGEYGTYGDYYLMNGRRGGAWDIPMLPLTQVSGPFFFSTLQPRRFGRGGFRDGR